MLSGPLYTLIFSTSLLWWVFESVEAEEVQMFKKEEEDRKKNERKFSEVGEKT